MFLLLLLVMVGFMVWVIGASHARLDWWQDEVDADRFIAELREGPRLVWPVDVVEVAMLDGRLPERAP